MKAKALIQVLTALLIPVLFYIVMSGFKESNTEAVNSIKIQNPPAPNQPKDFVNYILNRDYWEYCNNPRPTYFLEDWMSYYRGELNYTGVHIYDADSGTCALGYFNKSMTGGQIDHVNALIAGAHQNGLKAIYERSNLGRLFYSQRLVYEVANGSGHTDVNYGFCYRNISGNYEVEPDGTTAIHACVNPQQCNEQEWDASPQYICSNIYENLQHTDLGDYGPQARDFWEWNLKPRMKIKQGDFDDPNKQTLPVVTIEAYCFDNINNNVPIASKTIKVRNFGDGTGHYDGVYIEKYDFQFEPPGTNMWLPGNSDNGLNKGRTSEWWLWDTQCHVDFKIYWHGNVDVWFDKLTVDDYRADRLFAPPPNNYDPFIDAELTNFAGGMDFFYADEITHSNIPCVKRVIDYIHNKPGYENTKLLCAVTNYLNVHGMKNDSWGFRPIFESVHPYYFQTDMHKIFGGPGGYNYIPNSFTNYDTKVPDSWKVIPAVYTNWFQNTVLGDKNTSTVTGGPGGGSLIYDLNMARVQSNQFNPGSRMFAQPQLQGHLYDTDFDGMFDWGLREPMNEEIETQAMISIARGADGLSWFWFQGIDNIEAPRGSQADPIMINDASVAHLYMYGLIDPPFGTGDTRTQNLYGQNKWQAVSDMNAKILSWKTVLDDVHWTNGYSIHSEGADYYYISDIRSVKRSTSPPYNYATEETEKYWELGFFEHDRDGDHSRYFMFVNRRCIPETSPGEGDKRQLKIKFDGSELAVFTNWMLIDVETNQRVLTFLRNSTEYHLIGEFEPGEGKLYKLAPVLERGGTLIANEEIEDQNFICEDTVSNNGYDIMITGSSDVSFSDSATIIMNGGTFQSGNDSGGPVSNKITYTSAVSGHKWGGLRFTDANVKIYNSEFKEIASPAGGEFAIQTIDCPLNDVRYNVFTCSTDTAGGVNIAYVNYSPFGAPPNSYVMYNNFAMNNSYSRAVQVQGFAGLTEGVYVKSNTMTSNGYATGIFLSTVTGGVIKNNNISGFETAINTMSSTCDLFANTISNSTNESKGIYAVESSVLNLAPSGSQWTGGMNNISNTKDNSININIDASNFLLMGGSNAFDLLSSAEEPFHLFGSFVSESYNSNATGNCFKLSGTEINDPDLPNNYLTDGYEQVTLDFISYNCSQSMPECSDIVSIGNGLYDTIPSTCGGGGGQKSETSNVKSETGTFVLTAKQLQDSIKIQMRHRNCSRVKTLCNELIGNYPESIEGISSLQTLYMATVLSDTTTSSRSALKAYYEGLILNHGNNEALVEISNYLVQKCKVLLRQYTSALAGFQTIINNNQYNYRGLLARWDYMATSLLMQGQGGGESSETPNVRCETGMVNESDESEEFEEFDKFGDDKNPYSKEERVAIQKNVRTVNEKSKNIGEKRIEILEREAKQNNQRAKNELQRINTMKQVIKTEKPKNVIEHIKIVNNDIQTVFGSTLSNKSTSINTIPSVYRLAQNYPNPFNPVTTIKYELPKDSKVKLVVYDLLGREVNTLVNEIKSAGYYQIEFNMQNYASGMYFYRIEADDLSSKKFIDAKKMVMVK